MSARLASTVDAGAYVPRGRAVCAPLPQVILQEITTGAMQPCMRRNCQWREAVPAAADCEKPDSAADING